MHDPDRLSHVAQPPIQWLGRGQLEPAATAQVVPTEVVLDIGCGLRPQSFFRPAVHLCCEPHGEYVSHLRRAFRNEPGVMVVESTARELLPKLPDRSVDSVFMMDVIEHLTPEDGRELIRQSERVARRQIVLFTPLGFLPQDYDEHDEDGWGLRGGQWQRHRSGWTPEDFPPGWEFFACRDFHTVNGKGEDLTEEYGAFWAIKNVPAAADEGSPLVVVSPSFPPEASPSAEALAPLFADCDASRLTLLSSQHATPYDVLRRVGQLPIDPSGIAGLESHRSALTPTFASGRLPTKLERLALPIQARRSVGQVVRAAESAGARAIVASLEGRLEFVAAASAANSLGLPLIAVAPPSASRLANRKLLPNYRQQAMARASVIWSPGNEALAQSLARRGQKTSGAESAEAVLGMVGLSVAERLPCKRSRDAVSSDAA